MWTLYPRMTRCAKWRAVLTCGRVCAAAVLATLLGAEGSKAIAGERFRLSDGAGIIRRVGRVNHDDARPVAESYPILLGPADEVHAPLGDPAIAKDGDLPGNLVVPPMFQPLLSRMWKHSQTFRRQCARLRAEPRLLVRVATASFVTQAGARALSHIERDGTRLEAAVYLSSHGAVTNPIELIAHEFEHIIEQLDGVDLPRLARLSPKSVWSTQSQSFETRRAQHQGRMVATEVEGRVE